MATHGKAREATIKALRTRTPFKRPGFAMSGMEGGTRDTGRLTDGPSRREYLSKVEAGEVWYTVMSYGTPIAWVTNEGQVVVPEIKYSMTTTHHQGLCKVYL